MRIIFVRHAEPDYSIDSLTEKGWKEAALLGQRVKNWDNITDFYISPKGRAQDTANESLKLIGRNGTTLKWLREFDCPIIDADGKERNIPWDFMPDYWTKQEKIYDKEDWTDIPVYKDSDIKDRYNEVKEGIDSLLAQYGYYRKDNYYVTDKENDDTTIVLFCHLGVTYVILGYLLGISPALLWHTVFIAPSSVTVLGCEERQKGICNFRLQTVGDTKHLHDGNEPISYYGFFADVFQK